MRVFLLSTRLLTVKRTCPSARCRWSWWCSHHPGRCLLFWSGCSHPHSECADPEPCDTQHNQHHAQVTTEPEKQYASLSCFEWKTNVFYTSRGRSITQKWCGSDVRKCHSKQTYTQDHDPVLPSDSFTTNEDNSSQWQMERKAVIIAPCVWNKMNCFQQTTPWCHLRGDNSTGSVYSCVCVYTWTETKHVIRVW